MVDQSSSTSLTVKYTRGIGFMGTVRLGHVFGQFNLLYARLGVDCSRDKVSFKAGASGNADISKKTFGFVPGFGFEHKWHAVVAGIEYSYAIGQKIKGNLVGVSRATTLEAQRKSHQVQFRVSCVF